jgi:hypothetical protein
MTICTVKCPDCEGVDHHWMANPDLILVGPEETSYTCLHCPARGIPCPECDGLGTVEDVFEPDDEAEEAGLLGYSLEEECPHCDGWGIVELPKPTRKSKPKSTPRRNPRGETR